MAASWLLILVLFITSLSTNKSVGKTVDDVSSLLVASKLDLRSYPGRNSGLPRHCKISSSTPICLKMAAGIRLIKLSLVAGYFVLLSNDVNLNPGPVAGAIICPWCNKVIRRNQAHLECVSCEMQYHWNVLGLSTIKSAVVICAMHNLPEIHVLQALPQLMNEFHYLSFGNLLICAVLK